MKQSDCIRQFLINIGMDLNNLQQFLEELDMLLNRYGEEVKKICILYRQTRRMEDIIEMREELSAKSGVHIYTIHAMIVILSSEWLIKEYKQKGYSEELFWDSCLI